MKEDCTHWTRNWQRDDDVDDGGNSVEVGETYKYPWYERGVPRTEVYYKPGDDTQGMAPTTENGATGTSGQNQTSRKIDLRYARGRALKYI